MEILVASAINNDNMMFLRPSTMDREALDNYYLDNEDYVAGWMGVRNVEMVITDMGTMNVIYVGTAGRRGNMEDYFFLPQGNAWARAPHGIGEAEIIGHVMLSNKAIAGIRYAADN